MNKRDLKHGLEVIKNMTPTGNGTYDKKYLNSMELGDGAYWARYQIGVYYGVKQYASVMDYSKGQAMAKLRKVLSSTYGIK